VKSTGPDRTAPPAPDAGVRAAADPVPRASGADGGTRVAVARLLLERGPVTAADVAAELELSAAAVRRHLDALLADGEATTRDAPRRGRRGRGRPARLYLLTEAGRVRFGHGYDDLAVAALRFLAETGGPGAVRDFAERRAAQLVRAHPGTEAGSPGGTPGAVSDLGETGGEHDSVAERVGSLAAVLSAQGYAAAARRAANGEQLCQHHCPVAHVAAEFPELCEAETHAFAELLGTHVQRLATIARGDAACTTHVPLGVADGIADSVPEGAPGDRAPLAERSATTTTVPKGRQSV
jgi:predicted ArsR family transcriptional regulator